MKLSGVTADRRRPLGRSGIEVTALGFGGGPVGKLPDSVGDDAAAAVVDTAYAAGIRYFDTAPLYGLGRSERRLGLALAGRPRDSFVLSTKVGRLLRTGPDTDRGGAVEIVYDYGRDGVLRSLDESLARLRLDRIDIALIHDIDRFTHGDRQPAMVRRALDGAYPALAELRDQGVIGAIGLGVNEWQVCRDVAERVDLDCVLLAGRYTLLEQEPAETFLPFCRDRGIGVIIGGPYNSGILATGPVSGASYNYQPAPSAVLERTRRIEAIASAHGVPLAAAALRFPLLHPAVTTVIPGAASVAELAQNLELLATAVPAALWHELKAEGLLADTAPTP